MDNLTYQAFKSLKQNILPKLAEELEKIDNPELDSIQATEELKFLVKESIALLKFLSGWIGIRKDLGDAAPLSLGEASDIPAEELVTELPDESAPQEEVTNESETPSPEEVSDDEAAQMLAAMDEPAVAAEGSAEMSDDEAAQALAAMDAPAAPAEGDGEMSDDEAAKMLAAMDAPASSDAAGDMSDDEAAKLLAAMDGSPSDSAPAAEPASEPASSSSATEEEVEEIEEFGESEFRQDPDMLKDFLNNSEELIEVLDDQILALEQSPSETEIIEEIFRAAHTLKGAAGMFAYLAIERVMHRMENFFDQVRKGKLEATSDAIDVILEAMDVIKILVAAAKENKPSGHKTAPIVKSLNQICAGKKAASSKKASKAPAEGEEAAQAAPKKEAKAKKQEQSTIRVDLRRLDALVNLVGELVIDRTRFVSIEEDLWSENSESDVASHMSETVQLFGRHMNEVQDIIMKVRMVPIGNSFNKFPRVVRDLAKSLDKEIDLVIEGEQTELDKTLVEQIGDPLVHLIRNAVDHGVEMPADREAAGKSRRGTVVLSARQEGNQIMITIQDDGKGMDREIIRNKGIEKGLISKDDNLTDREVFNLIFEAGFSTAAAVTNISGRGVGMDVVKKQISKLKGNIDISSTLGKGSQILIQLPLTLAIVKSLLVKARSETFAIPLNTVVESLRIKPAEIQKIGETEVIKRRNEVLPLLYLHEALALEGKAANCWYTNNSAVGESTDRRQSKKTNDRLFVVVVGSAERRFGIVVDTLLNQQEMVIKSMGPILREIPCVAGGAILGNGEVVLVLDIGELESVFRNKTRGIAA